MSLGILVGITLNLLIHLLTLLKFNSEPFVIEDVCCIAENLEGVVKNVHGDAKGDSMYIVFYYKDEKDEKRLWEIKKDYQSWELQARVKKNATEEDNARYRKEYNQEPNSLGFLTIKPEILNSRKKL
jgi:hypothetical protein